MGEMSTIQVSKKLKNELNGFKEHNKESYAEVITKLIDFKKNDEEAMLELNDDTLKGIKEAREDLKQGRTYTSKEIKKELGF